MEEQDEDERELVMKMLGVMDTIYLGERNEAYEKRGRRGGGERQGEER